MVLLVDVTMFKQVKLVVTQEASPQQRPAESTTVVSDLMLSSRGKVRHDSTPSPTGWVHTNLIFSVSEFRIHARQSGLRNIHSRGRNGLKERQVSAAVSWNAFFHVFHGTAMGKLRRPEASPPPLASRAPGQFLQSNPTKGGEEQGPGPRVPVPKSDLGTVSDLLPGAGRAQKSTKSEENFLQPSCPLLRGRKKGTSPTSVQ